MTRHHQIPSACDPCQATERAWPGGCPSTPLRRACRACPVLQLTHQLSGPDSPPCKNNGATHLQMILLACCTTTLLGCCAPAGGAAPATAFDTPPMNRGASCSRADAVARPCNRPPGSNHSSPRCYTASRGPGRLPGGGGGGTTAGQPPCHLATLPHRCPVDRAAAGDGSCNGCWSLYASSPHICRHCRPNFNFKYNGAKPPRQQMQQMSQQSRSDVAKRHGLCRRPLSAAAPGPARPMGGAVMHRAFGAGCLLQIHGPRPWGWQASTGAGRHPHALPSRHTVSTQANPPPLTAPCSRAKLMLVIPNTQLAEIM